MNSTSAQLLKLIQENPTAEIIVWQDVRSDEPSVSYEAKAEEYIECIDGEICIKNDNAASIDYTLSLCMFENVYGAIDRLCKTQKEADTTRRNLYNALPWQKAIVLYAA